jgi:hypothetical protein
MSTFSQMKIQDQSEYYGIERIFNGLHSMSLLATLRSSIAYCVRDYFTPGNGMYHVHVQI